MHARRALRIVGAALAAGLLAGCMTGQRPSFDTAPTARGTTTGDGAIDAVLQRLDAVDGVAFTAHYTATPATGTPVSVEVTQQSAASRSVTIGDVRYLTTGGTTTTCHVSTHQCEDGVDAALVSNTGLTNDIAFGDTAKRLRHDATIKVAASEASGATFAGQAATCVLVQVSGGAKKYCALEVGVLAQMISPDVTIVLDRFESKADPAQLRP